MQWDWTCGVEEVMNSLHHLVASGKVLYLVRVSDELHTSSTSADAHSSTQGISDAPSWIVTKANTYARMAGKTPFAIYQGPWSILQREFERDVIPMARAEGMALAPFTVLAGGRIRTDKEEEARKRTGENGACLTGGVRIVNLNSWILSCDIGRTIMRDDWERDEKERKVCKALEDVAQQVGAKSIQAGSSFPS